MFQKSDNEYRDLAVNTIHIHNDYFQFVVNSLQFLGHVTR